MLAKRAATASSDTDQMIGQAGIEVRTCAAQAGRPGAAMESMSVEMHGAAAIASDFAATSQRQTIHIGRLNEAVAQIDAAIQENATLVQRVSAASVALAQQSWALALAMAVFKPLPSATLQQRVAEALGLMECASSIMD